MQPLLKNALLKWVEELDNNHTPKWESLPDIDLYMDQVITYLERQLGIFLKSEEEKLVTPAMINNYVKSEVIPRPVQKKYTRDHMAHLMVVLNLKQVLSLMEITRLISHEAVEKPINVLFDQFNSIQEEALKKTSLRVREALEKLSGDFSEDDMEKRLSLLALKLSLEANASRIAAKRILDEILANKSKTNESKEKDKDKNKDREKEKDKSKSQ